MIQDFFTAIPWGILLAFTIGPVFFVLLETGAIKGFRAAFVFDIGVVSADFIFILIAYFSTNKILEQIKDDPALFVFGGILLLTYGVISFVKCRRDFRKNQDEDIHEHINKKNNYISLYFKGFLLNFINIGVLGFWLGVIIIAGPKLDMDSHRISMFFAGILTTYLFVDCIKIVLAKKLRSKLTHLLIFKIKRIISIVLIFFGFILMLQGFFPKEKQKLKQAIEKIKK
ncbi:LysE family translocator [Zhouia sp. PK063]|uniref:LysE family translocator n=1 Tax=Zhouia sp. PK063 TaxID=3373602 RepID=UPI0037969792